MARGRNEHAQTDALAYFLTWPTYGTWLPGDERGWIEYRRGWKMPDPFRRLEAEARMTEDACILDPAQRRLVEDTIHVHCVLRNWRLHAVNCRTNHLHIVVSAVGYKPKTVRSQFKAWCTRRLKEFERKRKEYEDDLQSFRNQWWAERGSQRWINDLESLERAVLYVAESQDRPREST